MNSEISAIPEGVPGPGEVIGGKYRVESVIGAGGMGVVLSARHLTLGQLVAIKVLVIEDEGARHEGSVRLLREARAAAALTSDHVVRIYDVGDDAGGRPFIVMERLFGVDLAQVLKTQGPLPVGEAVTLLIQACHALAEAHARGIVHRDLKPSNLFLTRRSDGSAHLKVLDFGIAKSRDPREIGEETLTGARVTLGSPSYMSPEQVRDARNVDARTDVWSLGAILYELVTGQLAFHGNTLLGVCASIITDTPPTPSELRKELPAELDALILRCLQKERTARFGSVEELTSALEPFAAPTLEFTSLVPSSWLPETLALATALDDPAAATTVEPSLEPPPALLVRSHDRTLESGAVPRVRGKSPRKLDRRLLIPVSVFVLSIASGMLWQVVRSRSEARTESVRREPAPPRSSGSASSVVTSARSPASPSAAASASSSPLASASATSVPARAAGGGRPPVRPRAPRIPSSSSEPGIRLSR